LLKAGLVNKSKAQQAKKQVRKKKRNPNANKRDTVADAVAKVQAEKMARDRELNRQKEIKQAAKARKDLLRQFLEKNMLNDPGAETPYNFVHGNSVKRIYVNDKQRLGLGEGKLAIVFFAERYFLVEAALTEKVRDMSPDCFVFVQQPDAGDEDDPYAEFQVPDDLMW